MVAQRSPKPFVRVRILVALPQRSERSMEDEIIKSVIIFMAWPGLLLSSVFIVWQEVHSYKKAPQRILARFVRRQALSGLSIMIFLGAVLTVSVFRPDMEITVLMLAMGFIGMGLLLILSQRWRREVVQLDISDPPLKEHGLSGMALHRLRTPLTGLKGCLDIVSDDEEGKLSETQKEYLEDAQQCTRRMSEIIDLLSSASEK